MPPQEITQPMSPPVQPTPAPMPLAPLTMGKWKASVTIVKESWAILMQDKEIMWFPVLSSIVSIVALIVMAAVLFFVSFGGDMHNFEEAGKGNASAGSYAIMFVYYLVMFFIANFFQAGIYIIAHGRFTGRDLSFRDGINGAVDNIGKIFIWSAISATVGMVLQMISDRSKLIGKIVAMIFGAAWNILTYFSLPSLVIGGLSVEDSFKQSASLIRKSWGETIIINLGVGLFFMLTIFLAFALAMGIVILVPSFIVGIGVFTLLMIFVLFISVISSTLGAIFKLALYEYAVTGKVPQGFTPELIQYAVRAK